MGELLPARTACPCVRRAFSFIPPARRGVWGQPVLSPCGALAVTNIPRGKGRLSDPPFQREDMHT